MKERKQLIVMQSCTMVALSCCYDCDEKSPIISRSARSLRLSTHVHMSREFEHIWHSIKSLISIEIPTGRKQLHKQSNNKAFHELQGAINILWILADANGLEAKEPSDILQPNSLNKALLLSHYILETPSVIRFTGKRDEGYRSEP
jgi:hypothetical protein